MTTSKQRGGTQIGWVNTSWPLASIEVKPNLICLNDMGKYIFSPENVTTIEKVGSIPFFFQGLRIHHQKPEYPEKIVFLTPYGRQSLIDTIRNAGFQIGEPRSVMRRGFPFRIPGAIAVVAIWNLAFFLDTKSFKSPKQIVGPSILVALIMVFLLATLLPKSIWLQRVFLKKDRNVGEVSNLLKLLQLITGIMTLGMGFSYFLE
jgi:hypothetical protein